MQFHCLYDVINMKMRSKAPDLLFLWYNKFENGKLTCRLILSMV